MPWRPRSGRTVTPGLSRSTSSAVALPSHLARTRKRSAIWPKVVHFLWPSRIQAPSSSPTGGLRRPGRRCRPRARRGRSAPRSSPRARAGSELLALRRAPPALDGVRHHVVHGEQRAHRRAAAADLLGEQAVGDHVAARPAVLGGDVGAEQVLARRAGRRARAGTASARSQASAWGAISRATKARNPARAARCSSSSSSFMIWSRGASDRGRRGSALALDEAR